MAQFKNTTISDTGFIQLPVGATAQRPTGSQGQIRFNSTLNLVEWFDQTNSFWIPVSMVPPNATGGTITTITESGINYRVHSFTNVGVTDFVVLRSGEIEYLIIGGGGGGGSTGSIQAGGGGGAGGFLTGTTIIEPGTYKINVGAGGASGVSSTNWDGYDGDPSSAFGYTAFGGGGGGGQQDRSGRPGASGGGRASGGGGGNQGTGVLGQGNRGGLSNNPGGANQPPYNASAGGGAGGPGGDSTSGDYPPNGGPGLASKITGTVTFYAGGGAAGQRNSGTGIGLGGIGGGGNGGVRSGAAAQNATANTGGGGGGGEFASNGDNGGNGGSGVVIVRYRIS